jgi:hypothetical protein
MPVTLTETVTFDPGVIGPVSGDPRTSASVRQPAQNLANRSRWLLARVAEVGGTYLPVSHTPTALTSCNVTTGVFTLAGHGLTANDPVRLTVGASGGTVPTLTTVDTIFYAVVLTADTFGLSATSGGSQLTGLGGALSGEVYAVKVTDAAGRIFMPASGSLPAGSLRSVLNNLPYAPLAGNNVWTGTNNFQNLSVTPFGGNANIAINGGISVVRPQELRIVNRKTISDTATSSSAYLSPQSGTAATGTIPSVWSMAASAADWFWLALDVPDGVTNFEVGIYTIGQHNGNPAHTASYQIIRYSPNAAETAISSVVPDSHTVGGGGNLLTTVTETPIAVTSLSTPLSGAYKYALLVNSPWDPISVLPVLEIRGLLVAFTANQVSALY